jgi:Ino eighty subunit 1
MRERKRIIEADQAALAHEVGPPKRGPKPKLDLKALEEGLGPAAILGRSSAKAAKYESDVDSVRSTPPASRSKPTPGARGRALKSSLAATAHPDSSPAPDSRTANPYATTPGSIGWDGSAIPARRSRPLTAHQLAVEANRNARVSHILTRGIRKLHRLAKKERKKSGAILRAVNRCAFMDDMLQDSEAEDYVRKPMGEGYPFRERGMVGLVQLRSEEDDFGEEWSAYAKAVRRMGRRLERWDGPAGVGLGVMGTKRRERAVREVESEEEGSEPEAESRALNPPRPSGRGAKRRSTGGAGPASKKRKGASQEEKLDDVEKMVLGLQSGEEEDDEAEEELSDDEKQLLGMGIGGESEEGESVMA